MMISMPLLLLLLCLSLILTTAAQEEVLVATTGVAAVMIVMVVVVVVEGVAWRNLKRLVPRSKRARSDSAARSRANGWSRPGRSECG